MNISVWKKCIKTLSFEREQDCVISLMSKIHFECFSKHWMKWKKNCFWKNTKIQKFEYIFLPKFPLVCFHPPKPCSGACKFKMYIDVGLQMVLSLCGMWLMFHGLAHGVFNIPFGNGFPRRLVVLLLHM
jgi:hypothetical protein